MKNKLRKYGAIFLAAVWLALTLFAWFKPAGEFSDAERRPLDQMPEITADTLLNGKFMKEFEDYTLDQFPLRDGFRQLKSLFHYYVLNQKDNNGIYIADGYAAEMEYPLETHSVEHALQQFSKVYEKYLKESGSTVFATVVPDKSYYLAEDNGYLSMDYEALFSQVREGMPWATHVDISDCLSIEDYYFTDTHWRQERLLPVAQRLSQAMGLTVPQAGDFAVTALERPFYGVYYGQAALPMSPETMYVLTNSMLDACTVYNYESGKETAVYDMEKLYAKDQYDVFLSGAQSLLTVTNPNAKTDRELIVFRDSFGSSLIPLLLQDYASVTLVDIRYISPELLDRFLEFKGQDVLFLYSTLVLNKNLI